MKCIAVNKKYYKLLKDNLKNIQVELLENEAQKADLIIGDNSTDNADICFHPSLLPSFNTKEPIKDAFCAGVKVSGVTVYCPKTDKIIAQYPVLIGNSTHYDEFEKEIHQLEHLLYPIVIDKILKDEVFDFNDLMGKCSGNCSGCNSCH